MKPRPCIPEEVSANIHDQLKYEYEQYEKSTNITECRMIDCSKQMEERSVFGGLSSVYLTRCFHNELFANAALAVYLCVDVFMIWWVIL